jgi:RDD family
MGSAQETETAEQLSFRATGTDGAPGLKEAVAERLAAHRNRRAAVQAVEAEAEARMRRHQELSHKELRRGASRVREAVAARYERSQSYREFLAAEAERALQQAQAEAEVAARNARAVAEAQMQLMEELEEWDAPETAPVRVPSPRERAIAEHRAEARGELAHALADIALGAEEFMAEPPLLVMEKASAASEVSAGGLTVRLYDDLGERAAVGVGFGVESTEVTPEELQELEREIEFRRAPQFTEHRIETMPIPANLIEFPRQLVASRKARPRLAEGPLREESPLEPQLRIFEVEAEQIATEPGASEATGVAEWQSLSLEAITVPERMAPLNAQAHFTTQPETAPTERRVMALAVDGCCVVLSFVGFATVVAEICGPRLRALNLPVLAGGSAVLVAFFAVAYQVLFFSLADATPGMLFARIGMCTFADSNPSRKALRRRIFASLLAACPLGLGLLWTLLDDEGLGWHDRMSRMYPRAY